MNLEESALQSRFCWSVWFEFLRFEFGCVDVFVCDERWLLHDGHVILILVYLYVPQLL